MLYHYCAAPLLLGLLTCFPSYAGSGGEPHVRAPRAQPSAGAFHAGDNLVNLGIGLGSRYTYVGSGVSATPAFSASYERGFRELGPGTLGLGAFVGYQSASSDFGSLGNYSFTDIIVGIRGAFHYPVSPQLDAYGGLGLGVRHAGVSFEGSSYPGVAASATGLYSGLFLGGRYLFSDHLGAFAELGYDQTYLKAGLTVKF